MVSPPLYPREFIEVDGRKVMPGPLCFNDIPVDVMDDVCVKRWDLFCANMTTQPPLPYYCALEAYLHTHFCS